MTLNKTVTDITINGELQTLYRAVQSDNLSHCDLNSSELLYYLASMSSYRKLDFE